MFDVDDGPDRGEREALGLELADPVEALEVLGVVEAVAALLGRRRQQALPGVVADRVDGEAGPLGQLVDPPAGLTHRPSGLDSDDTESIFSQSRYTRSYSSWCRR